MLGSCESNVNEDSNNDLRMLGNWDPKQQEKSHSTKLPMGIIRRKAGLLKGNGMNCNPRTVCEVPEGLRTQVFPFVQRAKKKFQDMQNRMNEEQLTAFTNKHRTAKAFLQMMDDMQTVLIQDVATVCVKHKDWIGHNLLHLPLFRTGEFATCVDKMRAHLDASEAPFDSELEHVLPGMNNQFASMKSDLHGIGAKQDDIKSVVTGLPSEVKDQLQEQLSDFPQSFSSAFAAAAQSPWSPRRRRVESVESEAPAAEEPPKKKQQRVNSAIVGCGHELPRVKKASDLWNAWFGLSKCKNQPIPGGIDAMEIQHKALWRRLHDRAANRTFSRWKNAIKCVKEEQSSCQKSNFLGDMDALFRSVFNFQSVLRTRKKARDGLKESNESNPVVGDVKEV